MRPYRRLGDSRKSVRAPRRSSASAERGGAGDATRPITRSQQRGTVAVVTTEKERLRASALSTERRKSICATCRGP